MDHWNLPLLRMLWCACSPTLGARLTCTLAPALCGLAYGSCLAPEGLAEDANAYPRCTHTTTLGCALALEFLCMRLAVIGAGMFKSVVQLGPREACLAVAINEHHPGIGLSTLTFWLVLTVVTAAGRFKNEQWLLQYAAPSMKKISPVRAGVLHSVPFGCTKAQDWREGSLPPRDKSLPSRSGSLAAGRRSSSPSESSWPLVTDPPLGERRWAMP